MRTIPVRFSGRSGEWVYYVRGNKQCRRRYVVPKDPRTPAQMRVRAAFGAASRYWSHTLELTEAQRDAWEAVANKRHSRPRELVAQCPAHAHLAGCPRARPQN